jgi:hypothetical protein
MDKYFESFFVYFSLLSQKISPKRLKPDFRTIQMGDSRFVLGQIHTLFNPKPGFLLIGSKFWTPADHEKEYLIMLKRTKLPFSFSQMVKTCFKSIILRQDLYYG